MDVMKTLMSSRSMGTGDDELEVNGSDEGLTAISQ